MWIVASAHFLLSFVILFKVVKHEILSHDFSVEYLAKAHTSKIVLALLQPHFWVITQFFPADLSGDSKSLLIAASLAFIPVWSFCFGWLCVKFFKWLNHFPILGKKVF